jgi:hypothetical protein
LANLNNVKSLLGTIGIILHNIGAIKYQLGSKHIKKLNRIKATKNPTRSLEVISGWKGTFRGIMPSGLLEAVIYKALVCENSSPAHTSSYKKYHLNPNSKPAYVNSIAIIAICQII